MALAERQLGKESLGITGMSHRWFEIWVIKAKCEGETSQFLKLFNHG